MVILKKLGVWSVAKIQAIIMALMGLFVGILVALATATGGTMRSTEVTPEATLFQAMGYLSVIILPIFYGLIGLVSGVVGAWLYNLIAKWVGGIEMEFSEKPKKI